MPPRRSDIFPGVGRDADYTLDDGGHLLDRYRLARERLWPALLAVAALFAAASTPARPLACFAGLFALIVVLVANAASSRRDVPSARAALVGFTATVLALVWAALGGVPGLALVALAVAALGGAAFFARGLFGAVGSVLLAAVAASSGAVARGELTDGLAIAAVVVIAGATVVLLMHELVLNLEEALQWARRREQAVSAAPSSEALEELDRARAEVLSVRQALLHEGEIRRQAEMRALESLRTKDAFLAVMSHELRTPLNQILGYSELLLEESMDADAAQIRGDVTRIHLAGRNLLEILDNTLDLSNIEAGKEMLQLEEVALQEFLQEVVDSMAAAARHRGNTLRLRCPKEIGAMRTDRVKLRKILGALLSNACKFTENGTVRLAVHRDPLTMRFEVSDTGVGIPPEALEHLFEPFYQADGSTTRRHDGAGLGLTLCRHITTMLGGDISVASELGKGTTLTLLLPLEFRSPRAEGIVVMSMSDSSVGAG